AATASALEGTQSMAAMAPTLAVPADELQARAPSPQAPAKPLPQRSTGSAGASTSQVHRRTNWWHYRWIAASAAALLASALTFAGIVFRVTTPVGTVIVEIDQPEVIGAEVSVDSEYKITIKTKNSQEPINVSADEKQHTLKVEKGGFETFTRQFTVKA